MAKSEETRGETRSDRVKFIYNAQFPAPTAVVLDYLLNNPHFTSRQGRQQGMDAIAAFYRPMAQEARAELPEDEVREIARHCVDRLAQQIEVLCNRYHLESPVHFGVTSHEGADIKKLEIVLESGFQSIAEALRSTQVATSDRSIMPANSTFDIEQGVEMDGDELGDLGAML
ncbi:MAG: hypothetical protein AAF821_08045 [Cyanobacteria bacterium P01_D01_bin.156]